MITVNSLSGGKTSSYMACKYPTDYNIFSLVCIDNKKLQIKDKSLVKYVSEKINKDFIATAEDDKTLIVMRDLEQIIQKEIIWVTGQSFDDLLLNGKTTRLPSWARRYCTFEMKIKPIFEFCYINFGEEVKMNIGFRFDEFKRMENFYNSQPNFYNVPILCDVKSKRQKFEKVKWRTCYFPLVGGGVKKNDIDIFWENYQIKSNLFEQSKKIDFPQVSNCVGCFHKNKHIINSMNTIHPEKMKWFADMEKIGKGTWHDDKITYEETFLKDFSKSEISFEIKNGIFSCDSEGCTQ